MRVKLRHPPSTPVTHDPGVVAPIVADQRRVVAAEAGHHQVAFLAVRHELVGVDIGGSPGSSLFPERSPARA